jgi:putative transposase
MGKKHFTEEQISFALRQAESGTSVAEIIRELGISEQTFYRWKKRFAGLGIAELRRLRIIEEENRKLKQLVADLGLDKKMLQDVLSKNFEARGAACSGAEDAGGDGRAERRACRVLGFSRTTNRYGSRRSLRAELRVRLRDLAASRLHYGYQRLWVLLRREGWIVNKKLVYRVYSETGLGIRRRKQRRRKSVQVREARPPTGQTNESWSMAFMADQLVGGQRFRRLPLVDNHSRESLAIEAGKRLTGNDVVRALEQVTALLGKPQSIRVDNGPEFISRSLDPWAYFNGVKLDFSRPGKPTDNAFIESFNGWLRVECLNQHWFLSLDEARAVTEAWRDDYNRVRAHGALGNRTPSEFARPVDGHAHLPALHG